MDSAYSPCWSAEASSYARRPCVRSQRAAVSRKGDGHTFRLMRSRLPAPRASACLLHVVSLGQKLVFWALPHLRSVWPLGFKLQSLNLRSCITSLTSKGQRSTCFWSWNKSQLSLGWKASMVLSPVIEVGVLTYAQGYAQGFQQPCDSVKQPDE